MKVGNQKNGSASTSPSPVAVQTKFFLLSTLLIAGAAVSTPVKAASYSGADIISRTNAVRSEQGLSVLHSSSALNSAAHKKAQDMFAKQYFAHFSPSGQSPWSFVRAAGYNFTQAGENLAIDYTSGAGVLSGWMASPTHRANILSTKFADIGVAVVDGIMNGSDTTLVVQFFGSRTTATATTTPKVSPPAPTPKPASKPAPAVTAKPKVVKVVPVPVKVVPVVESQPEPVREPIVLSWEDAVGPRTADLETAPLVPTPTTQPEPILPYIPLLPGSYVLGASAGAPSASLPIVPGLHQMILAVFAVYGALLGVLALVWGKIFPSRQGLQLVTAA